MDIDAPRVSQLDRAIAWSKLATELFGDDGAPELSFDGFVIRGVLGRGAIGTVYRAEQPSLEREVAIKLVEGAKPESVWREARALARVTHPNVVAVHHVGEHAGSVYIVMERIEGEDLRTWQSAPRSRSALLGLYLDLARGLAAAHELGVVHRDFKPDNVRVDPRGRPVILDFGLASSPGLERELGGGTPAYMAPEQRAGAPADPRMDQYAWAVALGEAWTAREELVPPPLDAALQRARSPDPADRWPSMAALIEACRSASMPGDPARARILDELDETWLAAASDARQSGLRLTPPLVRGQAAELSEAELDRLVLGGASVLLTGGPGSGKTTQLIALARRARERAGRDTAPVPVLTSLSSWSSSKGEARAWLLDILRVEYGVPASLAQPWFDTHALVLFLDGLDEVAPERQAECLAAIESLRGELLIGIVLSSRTQALAELEPGPGWTRVHLRPLSPTFVEAALIDAGHGELAAELRRSSGLDELVTSPLAVELIVELADDRPLDPELDAEPALTEALLERLIERRLASAPPGLRGQLEGLARVLERQGLSELWVERMQPEWLASKPWIRIHQLGSLLITALMLALIVGASLAPATGAALALLSATLVGPVLAGVVALDRGLGRVTTVERLRWSWAQLRAGWTHALSRALVLAALISAIATLSWAPGQPLVFALAIAISNFVTYALLLSIVLGVLAGLRGEALEGRVRRGEGLRASARNTIYVTTVVALALVLPLLAASLGAEAVPVPELEGEALARWRAAPRPFFAVLALCISLTLASIAGLMRGGFALIQHALLRALLALAGVLPLRLGRLLDQAVQTGLVRRSGGGHRFAHPSVQARLARSSSAALDC